MPLSQSSIASGRWTPKPVGTTCDTDGTVCTTEVCDGAGACDIVNRPLFVACEDDFIECGYCDRRFVLSAQAHDENEYLSPAARAPEAH